MGMVAVIRSSVAGSDSRSAVISVDVIPGRTAFTRTPSAATSFARPTVNVSTAAFDAA